MKTWIFCFLLGVLTLGTIPISKADSSPSWPVWLAQFKQEAVADGINPEFFDRTFAGVQPAKTVINLDKRQPEKRLSFLKYRSTRADPFRIQLGQREYRKYHDILTNVGASFGVDACFVTSLWGMETSYGRYLGTFPVIQALATLAYDKRRSERFRKELLIALHILQEGHVAPDKFIGEWAGASGQPQFLPSSWQKYAVDYDHDGHKNIWTSYPDAFASIANYLKQNGWKIGEPWAIEVSVPSGLNEQLFKDRIDKSVGEWKSLGVKALSGNTLPNDNLQAAVIKPDGGPALMIFNNFRVLLKYNNSIYYAGTVGYMADRICKRA